MTAPASVYPRSVDDLLPDAIALAVALGEIPSRNRLMKEFRIGVPKASALHEALSLPKVQQDDAMGTPPLWTEPVSTVPAEVHPPVPSEPVIMPQASPQVAVDGHPVPMITDHPDVATPPAPVVAARKPHKPVVWPVLLMSLSAFVGIWSGWVELGKLTGFGLVNLLPGIAPDGGWATLNTAITLPLGVEAYAAYALWVWLSGRAPRTARRFARASAIGSLLLGMAGQASYHLLVSAGITAAPWWLTTLVSALPVAVLGMGAALAHMQYADHDAA